jgi:hypothetical protein
MWVLRILLIPVLLATPVACERQGVAERAAVTETDKGHPPLAVHPPLVGGAIEWSRSAGVFIGIEQFHERPGAPLPVKYASDDATDLAYLFTRELLPSSKTALILAGRPHKTTSQAHLTALVSEAKVIVDDRDSPVDAAAIYAEIREEAEHVEAGGVLIISIATHGYTTPDGRHILLMPDTTMHELQGVELAKLLACIPAERASRVILFVDACRAEIDPDEPQPDPRGALPTKFFEELKLPGNYVAFIAARAGEFAQGDERAQNGFFTEAVLEALNCNGNAAGPDGYLTPSALDEYVTRRVRVLTHDAQRPDSRFGGLGNQPLIACRPAKPVAEILSPKDGQSVLLGDSVRLRTFLPDLSATVLACGSSGDCWNANPGLSAALVPVSGHATIPVQYGTADEYQVWVALSADRNFLRNESDFSNVPIDRIANRIVYWIGPVKVTAAPAPDAPKKNPEGD